MTEEEAQTKYCPKSADANGAWSKCMGSACMGWREVVSTFMYSPSNGTRVLPGQIVLRSSVEERREVVGGYCGLIGRPE
jgi:hypothetical protein